MEGNGAKIALGWTVTNNSSADAVSFWNDNVYLSATPTLDFNNYGSYWNLGTFSEPLAGPLVAGGSYTQNRTVTVPNTGSVAGTFYLIVATNQGGEQPVTGAADAIASTPIDLTLPAVNLAVTQVTNAPSSVVAGGAYTLAYTVQNQGSDPANDANWTDAIYSRAMRASTTRRSRWAAIRFTPTRPWQRGAYYAASTTVKFQATPAAVEYYLLIVPNQSQGQAETNSNNAFPVAITVSIPDVKLATTITSSPASPALGSTFPVSWQVTNDGSQATAPATGTTRCTSPRRRLSATRRLARAVSTSAARPCR